MKGIVASRLVNTYRVPSLLFTIEDGEARGSGRSVGDINLFKAVEHCKHLLTRYGGHEAAVGVTLPSENLDEFYRELCSYLDTFPAECFEASVKADALVDLSELTLENVAKIDLLAPFGQENAVPHYLARGVFLEQAKAVGAEKNHLSARLSDGVDSVAAIMFRAPNIAEMLRCKYVEELQKRQSDGGPYRTARCFGLPMLRSGDHLLSSRAERFILRYVSLCFF